MNALMQFFGLLLAVASWAAPQPRYSAGLLVVYGNQQLVEANADWRGYDLGAVPERCGFAAISPAMLGQLAWISRDGRDWVGPCLSVDAVARGDAYGSIFQRHEVGEVSRSVAERLGFTHGAPGLVYFGACPPDARHRQQPQAYRPPLAWDHPPADHTPSFYPYPKQQAGDFCGKEGSR